MAAALPRAGDGAGSVRTTCPYCGVGCGVRAAPGARGVIEISGDAQHPANRGRLCVKGAALGETLTHEGRLLHPQLRRGDRLERASWDDALDTVAEGFRRTIETHGPDSVALYVSGQLLTEDYYVANKLAKGFFGTANIDTNSRLCMSSAVAAHKRAFGADAVPLNYEDLELADLVVLVGSNTAWCHPVLYQRILAAKAERPSMQLVVIDPRRTATCEQADLHLPVKPGSDVWLFNGLLAYLHRHGAVDAPFVAAHTSGAESAVQTAELATGGTAHVARACGIAEDKLLAFYRMFAATERVVTAFSQGVNQSSAGVDKANSIINCHLFTGRIGKPGSGPFSITGQPNAMGGREVGGLANMLAAHLELGEVSHRELAQTFWASPRIAERPGLKAVELFEAIHAGRVKAVWIMATNPAVSLPEADRVREALSRCELVVVSEVVERTDTTELAHVLLPAAAWGEKDGTVTNSERRISRQRAFLAPAGEAKPDWWIISEVARRLGWGAEFPYASAREVFAEHARLSAYRNTPENTPSEESALVYRDFNLSGLAGLSAAAYDALEPVQWPVLPSQGGPQGIAQGTERLFGDGRFAHRDGRARLIPIVPRAPANLPDDEFPLVLNTGRVRDQWHTMTRTGLAPRLATHTAEPYVEIHPQDAMAFGVRDGRLARVSTRWGACVVRVKAVPDVTRRQIFVPIHWNGQTASDARVGALVNPVVDPISGEPEFKHTPARVEPFAVDWHAFVLSRRPLVRAALDGLLWWTRVQGTQFTRYEIAGRRAPADWRGWAKDLLSSAPPGTEWLQARDSASPMYRAALVCGDRLEACVFVSPHAENLPARGWLAGLFEREVLDDAERRALLIGQPADSREADAGPTVCSCFSVGRNTIVQAIREQGLQTPESLGAALKCGTNCGSCVPELRTLIVDTVAELD
jgi:assimilatory nitrate reductase catalytic subunit